MNVFNWCDTVIGTEQLIVDSVTVGSYSHTK